MLAMMTGVYFLAVTRTIAQTTPGMFENLNIPKLAVMTPSTNGTAKIWTGKLEMLEPSQALTLRQVGEVQVVVTDFSAIKPSPTSEQILANHERAIVRNKTFAGAHFKRTTCNFGERKVVVLDGSAIFNSPERVSPMYMISFAFVDGTQVYQFQAITLVQEKYEELLAKLNEMTLSGVKVSGWSSEVAGNFSIVGSPFAVKAPKALFPVLGEETDSSLESQYIGAVNVPKGLNYRYVLAALKEGDQRSDDEILAILTRAALKVDAPKGLKVEAGTGRARFTYMKGTVKLEALVQFRRKGKIAAVIAASGGPGYPFGGVELIEVK